MRRKASLTLNWGSETAKPVLTGGLSENNSQVLARAMSPLDTLPLIDDLASVRSRYDKEV